MKLFSAVMTGVFAAALTLSPAFAQDSAKQDIKDAGHDTKQAAKDTGRATKHASKKAYRGAKHGVNKAAGATERGASKVKEKTTDNK